MENNELSFEETTEILDFMAKNNTREFNFDKAMEEATEFNEALLKYKTKHPDNPKRPMPIDLLKEYADFMYRGLVAIKVILPELSDDEIDRAVNDHIDVKLTKLINYRAEGKYKGGL